MPAEAIRLPAPLDQLPLPPPPEYDRLLDATATCLASHGLTRTSMSDIAREMGVSRSTVYRQIGSVTEAATLLAAREVYRVLAAVPQIIATAEGPQAVTSFMAELIRTARSDPVARRILKEEPDLMGRTITRQLETLLDAAVETTASLLEAAMRRGLLREQDPHRLAHWLIRVCAILMLAPPPGDLDELLSDLVLPAL